MNFQISYAKTSLMNRIKEVLLEKHLKQIELSSTLGLAKSTVSQWVCGKTQPSLPMLFKIAEALDCDVIDLIAKKKSPRI
jgi:putative transcriptional regulator